MWIDIIFGIVVGYGLISGYSKGIIKTLFSVLSLTIGFAAAVTLTPLVTRFILTVFGSSGPLVPVTSFLITFFLALLLVRVLARILEKGLKTVRLNFVNKLGGGVLLAAIGVFLYSILITFMDRAQLIGEDTKQISNFYVLLDPLAESGIAIVKQIFPFVKGLWTNIIDAFSEAGQQIPSK